MVRLSKGANSPLPCQQVSIVVRSGSAVDVSAMLLGASGKVRSDADLVFYNRPTGPGVTYLPARQDVGDVVQVDTRAIPPEVAAVVVTASLDGAGAPTFGAAGPVCVLLLGPDDAEVARFEVPALGPETALVCVELYRHGAGWKVRAVGQGYANGLAGIATDFGVHVDDGTSSDPAPPASPPAPRPAEPSPPPSAPTDSSSAKRAQVASSTAVPQLDLRAALATPNTERAAPPTLDLRAALGPSAAPAVPPAVDLRSGLNLDRGKVTLQKNETVDLVRTGASSLDWITMGVGWAPARQGYDVDLDASVVALDEWGGLVDVVWFGQLMGCHGSIRHGGDNLVGSHGAGDDERIHVDLSSLPMALKNLVFTVTSYSGQRFSEVREAHCRLLNGIGPRAEELVRFTLSGSAPHTAALMCALRREGGSWQMTALGTFHDGRTVGDLAEAIGRVLG